MPSPMNMVLLAREGSVPNEEHLLDALKSMGTQVMVVRDLDECRRCIGDPSNHPLVLLAEMSSACGGEYDPDRYWEFLKFFAQARTAGDMSLVLLIRQDTEIKIFRGGHGIVSAMLRLPVDAKELLSILTRIFKRNEEHDEGPVYDLGD